MNLLNYNKSDVLKRTIPSIGFFIVGFLLGKFLLKMDFAPSLLCGWFLGGLIWGWSLTKTWFPKGIASVAFWTRDPARSVGYMILFMIRVFAACVVGIVALPVGLVITIITLIFMGKDKIDAKKEEEAEKKAMQEDQA